eukprot:SAG31_NODE_4390_length_3277_cov_1.888609_1_plen_180_part_10
MQKQTGETAFKLSPEHVGLRDFFFEYMNNLDPVMDPQNIWKNRLSRTICSEVLHLLRCGDYNIGAQSLPKPSASGESHRMPDSDLVSCLVHQLVVADDAGWRQSQSLQLNPTVHTEKSVVVFHLKLTLAKMLLFFADVWRVLKLEDVVAAYLEEAQDDFKDAGTSLNFALHRLIYLLALL